MSMTNSDVSGETSLKTKTDTMGLWDSRQRTKTETDYCVQ